MYFYRLMNKDFIITLLLLYGIAEIRFVHTANKMTQ